MFEHHTQIRVRYGETDQMGYLYYGNYALYYEVGRTEAIRSLGMSYKDMEAEGVALPVVNCRLEYLRPAFYDDLITVKTMVKTIPDGSFITFHTELFNPAGKLINRGETTLAFYDIREKKKTNAPDNLKRKLENFFQ